MFLVEISDCIAEATSIMKLKEVPFVVELCCKLHHDYFDFSQNINASLIKIFQASTEMARRRVTLRLFTELELVHVWPASDSIAMMVGMLCEPLSDDVPQVCK